MTAGTSASSASRPAPTGNASSERGAGSTARALRADSALAVSVAAGAVVVLGTGITVGHHVDATIAPQVDHQLGEQPERDQLDGHDDEQDPDLERRPVADAVTGDLQDEHPGEQRSADPAEGDPESTEQMERPGGVRGEELDRDEVEKAAEEARPPELRAPVQPRRVDDADLADLEAVPLREHRDVPVQLPVDDERQHHLAAHGLEPGVEVLPLHAGDRGGDHVVDARGMALDEAVVARRAP